MREVAIFIAEAMLTIGVGYLGWVVTFFFLGLLGALFGYKPGPRGLFSRGGSADDRRRDGESVPFDGSEREVEPVFDNTDDQDGTVH